MHFAGAHTIEVAHCEVCCVFQRRLFYFTGILGTQIHPAKMWKQKCITPPISSNKRRDISTYIAHLLLMVIILRLQTKTKV